MSKLFIAQDAAGDLRFIGEVERGAECGCLCPECGSPLVARQGMANDWHFAHEAAQERPECGAAALRLFRRFVIEQVQQQMVAPDFMLPIYRQEVTLARSLVHLREDAQWGPQVLGEVQWGPEGLEDTPVARARLDTGVDLLLFVRVGDAAPAPAIAPADTEV
ncbi:MAG: competence protein CoiA family protein, partial [Hydrogenophaga sp.]